MKVKSILILSILTIILCLQGLIKCFTKPSTFTMVMLIVKVTLSFIFLRLYFKENPKKLSFKFPKKLYPTYILKRMPGFRSGQKVNMIFAGIYYSILLIWGIISIIFLSGNGIELTLSGILFPLMLFSFVSNSSNT